MRRGPGCAVVLALLSGCTAKTALKMDWANEQQLRQSVRESSEPLEVLYRGRKIMLILAAEAYRQEQVHEAKLVRTEGAADDAEVRISRWSESKLLKLQGRVLFPDGRVEVVDSSQMRESKADTVEGTSEGYWAFRFPRVVPGCILEYLYTVEHPHIGWYHSGAMVDEVPVRRYELTLTFDPQLIWAATVYGTETQFSRTEEHGRTVISWKGQDLPARKDEQLAAPWQVDRPWWAFRIKQFTLGATYDANQTWNSAMNPIARRYYVERELYRDLPLKLDVRSCEDELCKVRRAWALVRARTRFGGFSDVHESRSMKDVVDSGRASSTEKALLLRWLLAQVGVTAELAALQRPLTGYLDKDFPTDENFNHLILSTATPTGRLWMDPSCEFCEPGMLPPWSNGAEVLRFYSFGDEAFVTSTQTEFALATGEPAPASNLRSTVKLQVAADGAATVKWEQESEGAQGQWARLTAANVSPGESKEVLRHWVTDVEKTAEVEAINPLSCEGGRCRLAVEFRIPAYATAQEDRLLVPLSLLRSRVDGLLASDQREGDLFIDEPERHEQVLNIELPEGYVLEQPPAPAQASSAAFSTVLAVQAQPGKAVVRRNLQVKMGSFPKASYETLRKPVRAFAAFRERVLVFRRVAPAVAPAASP